MKIHRFAASLCKFAPVFLFLSLCPVLLQSQASLDQLVQQSTFIFQGTVIGPQERSPTGRIPSERTVRVRVDRLIESPALVSLAPGDEVTLSLSSEKIEAGQQAFFFAQGWLLGKSIALREVAHLSLEQTHELPKEVAAARARLSEHDLVARIVSSELVVAGRITEIRETGENRRILSEHEPMWQDATIQISQVIKGSYAEKTAVLRFPSSRDTAWASAPKFQVGQMGVWILHRYEWRPPARAYVALDPLDYQPIEQRETIERLARTAK